MIQHVQDEFRRTGKTRKQLGGVIKAFIDKKRIELESLNDDAVINDITPKTFIAQHEAEFEEAIASSYFQGLPQLNIQNKKALRSIARLAVTKDYYTDGHTGIVIAGFGEDEMFPSCIEIVIDGMIDHKLKFKEEFSHGISINDPSCIRAFAQKEMVQRFMNGIDPYYDQYIDNYMLEAMKKLSDEIIDTHVQGTSQKKETIKQTVEQTISKLFQNFLHQAANFQRDAFWSPIVGMVSGMPKSELAHMAEALVNLTSLKRRVSAEKETVGGPIDVAVISKGDGFVWIKRKYYFDVSMNQDFMKRYFERRGDA